MPTHRRPPESVSVVDLVSSNSSSQYRQSWDQDVELSRCELSTYTGHEFDLQTTIRRYDPINERSDIVYSPLGKDYLAGNGEEIEFGLSYPIPEDHELVVDVDNVDTQGNDYHVNLRIEVTADGF